MEKKLQRNTQEGALAGVCAGLADYFAIDKTWIRVAFVISVFFAGYGIGLLGPIVYIVLWIVLPVKSFAFPKDPFHVDYRAYQTDYRSPAAEETDTYRTHEQSQANFKGDIYQAVPRRKSKDRYTAGIILLSIGVFFLLHQLDLFYWRDVLRYWPVVLIVIGLASIFDAFSGSRKTDSYADPLEEEDPKKADDTPLDNDPADSDPHSDRS